MKSSQTLLLLSTTLLLGGLGCASSSSLGRAPLNFDQRLDRITVGSCSDQKSAQPLWIEIARTEPQLHLSIGDNIYASQKTDRPFSEMYEKQNNIPEYKSFKAKTPIIAIWDDHDYGLNDGGSENPDKEEALQAFVKNYPYVEDFLAQKTNGLYHSVAQGSAQQKVHIIALDTRWNRSPLKKALNPKSSLHKFDPDPNPANTILGPAQWQWFENEIKKPAEIKVIISSIQVLPTEHGFEKWSNFPLERARFLNTLGLSPTRNILIVSGDRHLGEISTLDLKVAGRPTMKVVELTASSINRPSTITEEPNKLRFGDLEPKTNFGLIQIDWLSGLITVNLKNAQGEIVSSIQRPLVF